MKKYLFGYLFVRIAKLLAVLTLLAGVGYALFRLEQASLAAQSASYQPSQSLRESLARLADTLTEARGLVSTFCEANGGVAPTLPPVDFSGVCRDNDDFARLANELGQADQSRHQLKETLVTRFETLVTGIEGKLRAHAAEMAPVAPPPVAAAGAIPAPTPRPTPVPPSEVETLYGNGMDGYEVQQKTSVLNRGKELLKVLETAAENPDNRRSLTDSVAQLDALSHLLPTPVERLVMPDQPIQPERVAATPAAPRRELNAEKVADQLARLRGSVRQTLLSAWTLDTAYMQASALAAEEGGRCRLATLTVKGIWVAAFGQLGLALLVAIFVAFLVLVLADFMQTLLDTATNTGVMAQATRPRP